MKTSPPSTTINPLKITLIGGSGLIGRSLAPLLRARGHEVVIASPSHGVNTLTGEGLPSALAGAQVVVDVTNAPSFEDTAVRAFFETSTQNLLTAATAAGVQHFVALSVVGTDRLTSSGYFRAKLVQESLIKAGTLPFTIVRATQFFEFVGAIAASSVDGDKLRLPTALFQPIAAVDVAAALADIVPAAPINGMIEIAGPEAAPMDAIVRRYLHAQNDPREVIGDRTANYFGLSLDDRSLTPSPGARLGSTWFENWLSQTAARVT